MENYQLSQENLSELRRAHKKTREKWVADRIKVVYLLGSGWAVGDVAQAVMVDENTVRSHFQAWKSGGIQGLEQRHYRGKISRLTEVQKEELAKWLDENLCSKAEKISRHIRKMYGVELSVHYTCKLLHRLGFVYKKPKHV